MAATASADDLTLYQMEYCPFCQRVRDTLTELKLKITMKDTWEDPAARQELAEGGGRSTVPCLRIEKAGQGTQWMYESADIIRYLRDRFAR